MRRNGQNGGRGDGGSVLTEFVIVAPLYLLLFGGVLLLNDMIGLKSKVSELDVFVTVAGSHRAYAGQAEQVSAAIKRRVTAFLPGAVTIHNAIAEAFVTDEDVALRNNWNAVYAGRADVSYRQPEPFCYLLEVQNLVQGEKFDEPARYRFFADPATKDFPTEGEKVYRFHLLQRHWTSGGGDGSYDRGASAASLVGDSILANVVGDDWLFTKKTSSVSSGVGGATEEYKIQLGKYTE